jgi:hypothetical protein
MGQQLFTHHDKYHLHKVLGFGCLFNFFLRIYWLLANGSMYIYADARYSLLIPVAHLTLSVSSLIFQVPLTRLNSKIIIWKELQLHNMVFTSRSAMIMIYSIVCIRNDIDMSNKHYYLYLIGKLALVVLHHLLADYITVKYNTNEKTTTRDINWENIPDNVKKSLKQYYAICQILAINALILTDNDKTGSGVMEAAFLVMFPIQLSTFLMTLVRKSIITNIYWHIFYSLSLVSPYFLIINTLRSDSGDSSDSSDSVGIYKNKLEIAKIYLPILYIIFRLQYNFNKYYLMFHIFIINFYIQYRNGLIVL